MMYKQFVRIITISYQLSQAGEAAEKQSIELEAASFLFLSFVVLCVQFDFK